FLFCCFFALSAQAQEPFPSIYHLLDQSEGDAQSLPEYTTIENLYQLNSKDLDFSPIPYRDGIVFTSTRKPQKQWLKNLFKKEFSHLFYAQQNANGDFVAPQALSGAINGRLNEGTATFSADGQTMIFTRNSTQKNSCGYYELQLYSAQLEADQWEQVEALPLNNEQYTNCHPSLSADGQRLYFVSNRPGGYGGMDLYVSERINQHWQQPKNLGPEVNSPQHELFPHIDPNGQLFFSSDAPGGWGQLDLYVAQLQSDQSWAPRRNLGQPFNSPEDDFGWAIAADGQSGWLSSNRAGGMGGDDLYRWQIAPWPNMETPLLSQIRIQDAHDGQDLVETQLRLIELHIPLSNPSNNTAPLRIANELNDAFLELIGSEIFPVKIMDESHYYALEADQHYLLLAQNSAYEPIQQLVSTTQLSQSYALALTPLEIETPVALAQSEALPPMLSSNVPLVAATAILPIASQPNPSTEIMEAPSVHVSEATTPHTALERRSPSGTRMIEVDHIYYQLNEFQLNADAKAALSPLIDLLQKDDKSTLRILSHTDARGSALYNRRLSERRAKAVQQYLIQQGIVAERIVAIGMGESDLLNACDDQLICTEEEHRANRRTEFELSAH
ncbi:MAG: OmpA family protein, partial [Bacteroidota bacterium]